MNKLKGTILAAAALAAVLAGCATKGGKAPEAQAAPGLNIMTRVTVREVMPQASVDQYDPEERGGEASWRFVNQSRLKIVIIFENGAVYNLEPGERRDIKLKYILPQGKGVFIHETGDGFVTYLAPKGKGERERIWFRAETLGGFQVLKTSSPGTVTFLRAGNQMPLWYSDPAKYIKETDGYVVGYGSSPAGEEAARVNALADLALRVSFHIKTLFREYYLNQNGKEISEVELDTTVESSLKAEDLEGSHFEKVRGELSGGVYYDAEKARVAEVLPLVTAKQTLEMRPDAPVNTAKQEEIAETLKDFWGELEQPASGLQQKLKQELSRRETEPTPAELSKAAEEAAQESAKAAAKKPAPAAAAGGFTTGERIFAGFLNLLPGFGSFCMADYGGATLIFLGYLVAGGLIAWELLDFNYGDAGASIPGNVGLGVVGAAMAFGFVRPFFFHRAGSVKQASLGEGLTITAAPDAVGRAALRLSYRVRF